MKKIILFFVLLLPLMALPQQVFKVSPTNGLVVAGLNFATYNVIDTAFYFQFASGAEPDEWSAQAQWIDVDTTGVLRLEVSDLGSMWEPYFDSLHIDIPDTTGHGGMEDDMFTWKKARFVLEFADTCKNGAFFLYINDIPK